MRPGRPQQWRSSSSALTFLKIEPRGVVGFRGILDASRWLRLRDCLIIAGWFELGHGAFSTDRSGTTGNPDLEHEKRYRDDENAVAERLRAPRPVTQRLRPRLLVCRGMDHASPTDPRGRSAIYHPAVYERSPTAFRDGRRMIDISPVTGDALPSLWCQAPLVHPGGQSPVRPNKRLPESRFRDA